MSIYHLLSQGNQDKLLLAPPATSGDIDEIIDSYSWSKFDPYENRYTAYTEELFDNIEMKGVKDDYQLWSKLNRGQKLFYAHLVFAGEVENGGIYQFFWNKQEFANAVLLTFEELKLNKLALDYEKNLKEFAPVHEEFIYLKMKLYQTKGNSDKKYIDAYVNAQKLFKPNERIEKYFYGKAFAKEYQKTMCDYIEKNRNLFVK